MSRLIGYCRVSTFEQHLDVQQALLRNAGATRIFGEHFTGKSRVGREQLDACLASLERGDTLLVVRLDRLARSIADLWTILKDLDARGVMFRCLTQPVDTTTPVGRFTISILGAAAEFELDMLRERRAEGIAKARLAGKYVRPVDTESAAEAKRLRNMGLGASAIARRLSERRGKPVAVRTVYRWTTGMWREG